MQTYPQISNLNNALISKGLRRPTGRVDALDAHLNNALISKGLRPGKSVTSDGAGGFKQCPDFKGIETDFGG